MNINIAVITTEIHLENFKNIESNLKNQCDLKYFVIDKIEDCTKYYIQNINDFDAFILSGPALYQSLSKDVKVLEKPCYTIADDMTNIYKQLLTLITHNPHIDYSRIYVDFANEYNNYLNLKDIFPRDNMPIFIPWKSQDFDEITDNVLANHLRLKKENKIDLSITRFGLLINKFKENNINHLFLIPSEEYLYECISRLVSEIKVKRLNDKNVAIGYISLDKFSLKEHENYDGYESDYYLLSLQREIIKFCKVFDYDIIVQRNNNFVELFITVEDIYKITDELTDCTLHSFIAKSLNTPISIGFGSGNNLNQARSNALEANKYARKNGGNCCFFVDENQKVIGPIEKSDAITFSKSPNPHILRISKSLGINNINLQKIISFSKKIGTNKLSSDDISQCLSVEKRSANRILNKIEEKEAAKITFEKRDSSKGRPTKYYELSFLDSKGNLKEE